MEGFFSVFTIELFNSGIRLATPILLAALGGALCNKAGVLNLALESKMLLGAFLGIVAAYYLGNTYLGILVAVIAGGLLGWLFAFLYHRYQVDLVILSIALNLIILFVAMRKFYEANIERTRAWLGRWLNRGPSRPER